MPALKPDIFTRTSATELAAHLAGDIATRITEAIARQGQASLVVSGGSTPRLLFQDLSHQKIDWDKVLITLADERWVDTADPASNERLVRSLLLQNAAAKARFVGLKNEALSAREGEKKCTKALAAIRRPFDLVLLGMGNDGHTASLFPGAMQLSAALAMHSGSDCMAIIPPQGPFERMTLTLPALLDSRKIILHITGEEKKAVLEKALADGPEEQMPIRCILRQQQTPVQIYWAP